MSSVVNCADVHGWMIQHSPICISQLPETPHFNFKTSKSTEHHPLHLSSASVEMEVQTFSISALNSQRMYLFYAFSLTSRNSIPLSTSTKSFPSLQPPGSHRAPATCLHQAQCIQSLIRSRSHSWRWNSPSVWAFFEKSAVARRQSERRVSLCSTVQNVWIPKSEKGERWRSIWSVSDPPKCVGVSGRESVCLGTAKLLRPLPHSPPEQIACDCISITHFRVTSHPHPQDSCEPDDMSTLLSSSKHLPHKLHSSYL